MGIPLIVSKSSLQSMRANLDFPQNHICVLGDVHVPLIHTPGGHIYFKWKPTTCQVGPSMPKNIHMVADGLNTVPAEAIPTVEKEDRISPDEPATEEEIRKAHVHLGHAETATLMRILRLSGKQVSHDRIELALEECKCDRIGPYPQNPIVSKYLPDAPGQTIFMDVCNPELINSSPALLIVCAIAKFVCARFLNSLRPLSDISPIESLGQPDGIPCIYCL